MTEQVYRVYSPSKIWMSPEAREAARENNMTEQEFARYLINRHRESGDPFAGDVGVAPGAEGIHGFPPHPLSGDVGEAEAAQHLLETELPFE
jgi:hypothetical protein